MMPDDAPPTPPNEPLAQLLTPPPPSMADQDTTGKDYAPNGYLQLKGDDAVEHSVPTQKWLQGQMEDLLAAEPDPVNRGKLRAELGQMYAQAHQQIEDHTSREIEASIKATNDAALLAGRTAVTLTPENDKVAALQYAAGLDAATHGSLNPADRAAREQWWHGKLAGDRLTALIDKGDWATAETVLDDNRAALSTDAKPFEVKIQGHKVAVEAQTTAQTFVESAMDAKSGTVDELKLNKLLATVSPEKRELVSKVTHEVQLRSEHAVKQQKEQVADDSYKQINAVSGPNNNGFWLVPPQVRQALNEANPSLYGRLRDEADRQFRDRGTVNHDQVITDKIAKDAFMALPPEERVNTKLDQFLAGRGASRAVGPDLTVQQQRDKEAIRKGEATRESAFVLQATAENRVPAWSTKAGKADRDAFEAQARIKFNDFAREHGKPPSEKEAADLIQQMGTNVVHEHWYGDQRTPQWKLDAEAREAALKGKAAKTTAPAAPAAPTAPAETKTLGGKVFTKKNGKWVTGG